MPSPLVAATVAALGSVLGLALVAANPFERCRARPASPQEPAAPARGGIAARENPIRLRKAFDDETAAVKVGLRNTSDREIHLQTVRGSCGCIRIGTVPKSIPARGEIEVPFTLRLQGTTGPFTKRVFVTSDDPVTPKLTITIEGEVGSRLLVEPGIAFVKRSAPDDVAATADLDVRSGADDSLQVLTAEASVPGVSVEKIMIGEDGTHVRLHVVAPEGVLPLRGTIRLRLGQYERIVRLTDGSNAPLLQGPPPARPPVGSRQRPVGAATLDVAFSGQDLGELEPCGCTAGMMGGLARRPARLRALAEPGVPFLAVSGGALVAGRDRIDVLRMHALTKALAAMGYSGLAPTRLELALGLGVLPAPGEDTVPMLAVDVEETTVEDRNLRRMWRVEQGDAFCYVTGVSAPPGSTETVPGLQFVDPRLALRELRGDLPVFAPLIVLANVGEAEARDLARYAGSPTLVLYAAGWTDPGPEDVDEGAVAFAPYPATGKYLGLARLHGRGGEGKWSVEYRPLVADLPEDDAMLALRKAHQDELRASGVVEAAAANPRFTPQALSGEKEFALLDGGSGNYAGSAACAACHVEATAVWTQSSHAHAMATLRKSGDDADPACVACHVVGYGTGRGFVSEARTPQFTDVGCEACHGPRADHVAFRAGARQAAPKEPALPPGRTACAGCHDGKHDPNFDFATRWRRIVHGR